MVTKNKRIYSNLFYQIIDDQRDEYMFVRSFKERYRHQFQIEDPLKNNHYRVGGEMILTPFVC